MSKNINTFKFRCINHIKHWINWFETMKVYRFLNSIIKLKNALELSKEFRLFLPGAKGKVLLIFLAPAFK